MNMAAPWLLVINARMNDEIAMKRTLDMCSGKAIARSSVMRLLPMAEAREFMRNCQWQSLLCDASQIQQVTT
ncbi:MAG: hypothetical protein ABI616_00570 [Pseudomonadota bacterium]